MDPLHALDGLLDPLGLTSAATGGTITFTGEDPVVPARHRLGACIGIPMVACAVGAVAFGRLRGLPAQDLALDLREAVHHITPNAFWHPTLAGEPAPHPLVIENPFLLTPYRTRDGRTVMASGVYPHLAAHWQRFLDIPPDTPGPPPRSPPGTPSSWRRRPTPRGCRSAWPGLPRNGSLIRRGRCWPPSR